MSFFSFSGFLEFSVFFRFFWFFRFFRFYLGVHTNTVENLWKLIKQEIRRQKISIHYTSAIARFYISRKKTKEEQMKILIRGLQRKDIKEFNELVQLIHEKF